MVDVPLTASVAIVRPLFELLDDEYDMCDAARWPEPFPDHDLSTEECAMSADIMEWVTQDIISMQRRKYLETVPEDKGSAKTSRTGLG